MFHAFSDASQLLGSGGTFEHGTVQWWEKNGSAQLETRVSGARQTGSLSFFSGGRCYPDPTLSCISLSWLEYRGCSTSAHSPYPLRVRIINADTTDEEWITVA